jgi:hypothetical protein
MRARMPHIYPHTSMHAQQAGRQGTVHLRGASAHRRAASRRSPVENNGD